MFNNLAKSRRFLISEDGPTAVEYAVMLALIVVACVVVDPEPRHQRPIAHSTRQQLAQRGLVMTAPDGAMGRRRRPIGVRPRVFLPRRQPSRSRPR